MFDDERVRPTETGAQLGRRDPLAVQRYKMIVSYRGTNFHGWQWQSVPKSWRGPLPPAGQGLATVQETLARTIATIVNHPVKVVGSSRTDSGVHAKGQVAHFDCRTDQIPVDGMRRAINARLPDDIIVRTIEPVPPTFDAIVGVHSKRYQYAIWRGSDRPIFQSDLYWHRWKPLNVAAMAEAAKRFVGTHDFKSFTKPGHKREHTTRTVLDCSLVERGEQLIVGVTGTGFLWHMVRIMVGTLAEVGMGRFDADSISEMLEKKDRRSAGLTAPPHGLYLQWIRYWADVDPENGPVESEQSNEGEDA